MRHYVAKPDQIASDTARWRDYGRILVCGADAGVSVFHAAIMRLISATRKLLFS